MPLTVAKPRAATISWRAPFRKTFVLIPSLVALGGLMGTGQLLTGTLTPPVSVIEPIGLSSWTLPGLWLFGPWSCPLPQRPFWPGIARRWRRQPFCLLAPCSRSSYWCRSRSSV